MGIFLEIRFENVEYSTSNYQDIPPKNPQTFPHGSKNSTA
jgi:hypothetical protein